MVQHPDLGQNSIEWLGVQYKILLPATQTGGAIAIFESLSPVGSGPPRHIHHGVDETFVLLSGACNFWMNGVVEPRAEGAAIFVPRGTEHTFQVVGDKPCRHLTIVTPGGLEGFFIEMARGKYLIPVNIQQVEEIAKRYGMTISGPPL